MRVTFRTPGEDRKWRRWFAWRPVKIDRTWFWLERVERHRCYRMDFSWTEYREIEDGQ